MENQKSKINLYFIIYVIGVLAGLTLTLLATWGDLESSYYGFDRTGGARLSSLSCPILMSNTETSSFSIQVKNSTERNLSPSVKTNISSPLTPITSYEDIDLAPGETKTLAWTLTPENIDLNRFIFARAWVYASYPLPDREATCGVVVLPLPFNGSVATWGMTILSLLGMGIGLYGQKQVIGQAGSATSLSRFVLLSILVIVGILTGYFGIWLLGVVVLAISVLVGVTVIGHSI